MTENQGVALIIAIMVAVLGVLLAAGFAVT